jgi:hypothetical protein
MSISRPLARLALPCFWVMASWGCAPRASSTPLGLGPLALAEQSAASLEQSAAKPKQARRAGPKSEPAPEAAQAEAKPDAEAEAQASLEDVSEVSEADTAGSKEPPAFAGLFAGKDVAIFRISGEPERQEVDEKAKIRIESESPTQLRVVLINSTDGSDLCELSAEVKGNSAQLDGGQPCFTAEGEGAISAEMTSGTLTLAGDRLSMTAEGTLSGTLGDREFNGSLSYSFKGTRQ